MIQKRNTGCLDGRARSSMRMFAIQDNKGWESSGYDAEAEQLWFERGHNRVRAADGSLEILAAEDDQAWEWTRYDSKAEHWWSEGEKNGFMVTDGTLRILPPPG